MCNGSKFGLFAVLALGMGLGAALLYDRGFSSKLNAEQAPVMTNRYTVVDTEGTNLIVTDNKTNILYYYTIDQGKEIGSDLKLRGSLDLNNIGQPSLKPTVTWEKKEPAKEPAK